MTSLTLVMLVVVLYGVSSRRYGRALALGGAAPTGAALVFGAVAVPTFYAVAFGALAALLLRLLGVGPRPAQPRLVLPAGVEPLVVFLLWAAFVTLVAPFLFNGIKVEAPGSSGHLMAGVVTTSNIAQITYLVLGVAVVIFLARSSSAGPELIGLAAGTVIVLSLWRYLFQMTGLPFPEGLFDNSPAFTYIETAPGGMPRFRGIMSEPAGLAGSCLIAVSYLLPRSKLLHGWRRVGAVLLAVVATYLGIISTSATFVVASIVLLLIVAATFLVRFVLRRMQVSGLVTVVACGVIVIALWVLPIVDDFVERVVNEKTSSSSFDDRSYLNSLAYDLFLDTFGFGVGIGANRASSFLAGLLSTTGLVGTLLFAFALFGLVRRAA
jgi:hypothetical protein